MQHRTRAAAPVSTRTSLREALEALEATRARVNTLGELRAWRERAARRYVRPSSTTTRKHQP